MSLTILWDQDDVLNDLQYEWFVQYKLDSNIYNLNYDDLKRNPPHEILNISKENYLKSLDKFRLEYYSTLLPNQEILDWFKVNGDKCNHIVLTATPLNCASISAEWCIRHFGKWVREFAFIPFKRNDNAFEFYRTKADWINWYGKIDIFIDDNFDNVTQVMVHSNNISCYTPKCPWNNGNSIKDILKEIERKIEINEDNEWFNGQII